MPDKRISVQGEENLSYVKLSRMLTAEREARQPASDPEAEILIPHASLLQEEGGSGDLASAWEYEEWEEPVVRSLGLEELPEEMPDQWKNGQIALTKEKHKSGEKAQKNANIHDGHRSRLRQRFRDEGGFDNFKDHEILEMLLMYGTPRKDVNGLAHELLDKFGSLKAVLEARPDMIIRAVKGIGESQATMIAMAVPLARVWERCAMAQPKKITNRSELEAYCKSKLLGSRTERFIVICVDAQCRLLGQRVISEGSLSEVSAYPRSVMETALNYNAHSVFFCHNHPGGTCAPSAEDVTSTVQLQRLLNGVGVLVLDHMIVADGKTYSMAQHGDIDFRMRC